MISSSSAASFPPFPSSVVSSPTFGSPHPHPRYSPPISPIQNFSTSSVASLSPSSSNLSLTSSPIEGSYQSIFKRQKLEPLILTATTSTAAVTNTNNTSVTNTNTSTISNISEISSLQFPSINSQNENISSSRRRRRNKLTENSSFDSSLPPLLTLKIPSRTSWFNLNLIDNIEKKSLIEFFPKRQPSITMTEPMPIIPYVKTIINENSNNNDNENISIDNEDNLPTSSSSSSPSSPSPSPSFIVGPTHASPISSSNYLQYRNYLIIRYHTQPDHYLTITEARRSLPVSVSAATRLHAFLEQWGLINSKCQQKNKNIFSSSNISPTPNELTSEFSLPDISSTDFVNVESEIYSSDDAGDENSESSSEFDSEVESSSDSQAN